MKISPRFLRTHPLLSLLPTSVLRKLASDTALREFPKGSVVFRQGDSCDAIYLIISGRCELRRIDDSGHPVTQVAGPGDTLGDRELLNRETYRSDVVVASDSLLLRIPCRDLNDLFRARPEVAGRFSLAVVDRRQRANVNKHAKRIVSVHSLSASVNDQAIAHGISAALSRITGSRVLLVHVVPHQARVTLSDWAHIEPELNGAFRFQKELHENLGGFYELELGATGNVREPIYIAPLLGHLGAYFDYVILQVERGAPAPSQLECLIQSDLSYIFLTVASENLYTFRLLVQQLEAQLKGNCTHVNPVLCVNAGVEEIVAEFGADLRRTGYPIHSYLRSFPSAASTGLIDPSPAYALQINRFAREIARCRLGLALSSGAARGLSHIGVIQVLEENGIEVDMVAGSSMGAYVGAVWAYGHDGEACEKFARELECRWGLCYLLDPVLPPRRGFIRTRRVLKRLRRSIGTAHFSELVRPLRIAATRLETVERVVFSTGEVAAAAEASIAIPGICVPVVIDGEAFIDGGIADPLPVDVLNEMGIERILAVNTIPTPEHLRHCVDVERELREESARWIGVREMLNRHVNYFARGNLFDILLRANHGCQTRVAEAAGRDADIVLQPWAYDARWHDFTHPGRYIALGRKVAEDRLAEIKALAQPHTDETTSPAPLAVAG